MSWKWLDGRRMAEKVWLTADPVMICTGAFGLVYGWS